MRRSVDMFSHTLDKKISLHFVRPTKQKPQVHPDGIQCVELQLNVYKNKTFSPFKSFETYSSSENEHNFHSKMYQSMFKERILIWNPG